MDWPSRLRDLTDVNPASLADLSVPVYNSTTGKFEMQGLGTGARAPAKGDDPVPRDGRGGWLPSHAGFLIGPSMPPATFSSTIQTAAGFIYLARMWVPATVTVANLVVYVQAAGVTLTSGQCLGGIYDSTGALVAQTASQHTNWGSTGLKSMALTAQAGQSLTIAGAVGKFVWGALLCNGTTMPKFSATAAGATWPWHAGRGYPYAATPNAGAQHDIGFESVGGRTALVALGALTITDSAFLQSLGMGCT